jgi:2-haloacid dehalogenase
MAAYLRLETFPEVKGALADLKGIPLAILSNGAPKMLRAAVEHQSLGDAFTAVISVEEAGIFKPHPSVYALAPKHLGLPKEAIGFVSSNGWDVAGAANFGFQAFWINRTGNPAEELPGRPARVLQGLDDLRAWFP